MKTLLWNIVAGLLRLGASVVGLLVSPVRQRAKAEAAERDSRDAAAERDRADEAAVRSGDAAKVNARLRELLPLVAVLALACGCTRAVYVDSARVVEYVEVDGKRGWLVPDAVMIDLIRAAQRAHDLDYENAVKARMEGQR